jgi:gliding motility-associated-like protein
MDFEITGSATRSKMIWWLSLITLFLSITTQAQTDDLMIVEYLDSDPGSGFGMTIYNPTSSPINLNTYKIGVYNNGNTTGNEYPLSGVLAPGAFTKVGNTSYCGACAGGCDQSNTSGGVNGNDVIVLFKSPGMTYVDMIGLYGVDLTWQVEGTNNALYHHHLYRRGSNCTRYSSIDGTSPNSWPNTPTVNVQGWRVEAVTGSEACLKAEFAFDNSVQVKLPADTSFCAGSSVTIQPNPLPGFQYSWNTGQSTSGITVNTSGLFIITATKLGCKTKDSIFVDVKPKPVLQLNVADTSICEGDSILLKAQGNHPDWQFQWSTGELSPGIMVNEPGNYFLTVTKAGCSSKDTAKIEVVPLPVFSLGADTGFCKGDSVLLKSELPLLYLYQWNTGQTTPNIYVKKPGSYSLKVKKGNCFYSDSLVAVQHSLPEFELGPDRLICSGQTASLSLTDEKPDRHYKWNTGDTSRILVAGSGKYSLAVTDANGCRSQDTISVVPEVVVSFAISGNNQVCSNGSTSLQPGRNFNRYLWSTGDTGRILNVHNPGIYSVTGFSLIGCQNRSAEFEVMAIPCDYSIPNLITPNGDGENEVWKTKEPFLTSATVKVFNRWGQEVFSSGSPLFAWDGKNASSGNYYYVLNGVTVEGKNFQSNGWITVAK